MYYIKDADNDNISASNIDYDNSNSGLISTNVQNGLDELSSSVNTINSNLKNFLKNYIKSSDSALIIEGNNVGSTSITFDLDDGYNIVAVSTISTTNRAFVPAIYNIVNGNTVNISFRNLASSSISAIVTLNVLAALTIN